MVAAAAKAASSSATMSPEVTQPYKLASKRRLSPDSFLLRYALPAGRDFLGVDPTLPTCIKVDYQPDVEGHAALSKSYSPVSHPAQSGHFDLIVKSYPYAKGGGVGKYLCDMEVGASIRAALKGPRAMHGAPAALGRGWRNVGLVAGGTGIAPLLQLARLLLEDPDRAAAQVRLLCVNRGPADVLGREELAALAAAHPDRFSVTHAFTREGECEGDGVAGDECEVGAADAAILRGRGDAAMARAALPPPSAAEPTDTMVLVCGKDAFVAHWAGPVVRAPSGADGSKGPKIQGPLLGVLADAGYTAEQVFKY